MSRLGRPLQCGDSFYHDDAIWLIETVEEERNERFRWLRVTVRWSWFGRRPLYARELHTFLVGRTRIADGFVYS